MLFIIVEFLALPLRVVHLTEEVDKTLEELRASLEVCKVKVILADVEYHLVHKLLTHHRTVCIDVVKCILLQNYEVDKLALPETLVVIYRYTVITEDVNLVVSLLDRKSTRLELQSR